jgi:glucosyl-3-phosphoglycerate synthase
MVAASADHMEAGAPRTFHHRDFPVPKLQRFKDATVSVCLPARNEEATVGPIVESIHRDLIRTGVVDELLVIDDHSDDDTARVAEAAGAHVISSADILPEYGQGHGKGEVLWKSLLVTRGDIVIWCDADLRNFGSHMVAGVLGPLLCEPGIRFSKGYYERPEHEGLGGGRVTELVARPLLALLFDELSHLHQPLSGEYGGYRSVLEQLPFVEGYGVEVGLLIDLLRTQGAGAIAQVDLDMREHRNRSLGDLAPQAMAIMQTILRRTDRDLAPVIAELDIPGGQTTEVSCAERPPMMEVAESLEAHPRSLSASDTETQLAASSSAASIP